MASIEPEDNKHLLRGDLGDGAITDPGIGLVEQPANLAERDLGHPFAFLLGDPFLGDQLEAVLLEQHFAGDGELGLVRGIEAGRDHLARFVAPLARVAKADIGPGAEGECALLAEIGIVQPPELPAVRLDEEIEAGTVGELVFALPRSGARNGRRVEFSHGIGPSIRGLRYHAGYHICSRLVPDQPGFDRTILAQKVAEISHFSDVLGCPRKNKWCPEEDSNLHALSSAAT